MSGFGAVAQKAVYDLLKSSAPLLVKVTGVFDAVPQRQAYPFVVVESISQREENTDDVLRRVVTVDVHTWSRYRGMKETHEIQDLIQRAVDRKTVDGGADYDVVGIFESVSDSFLDADGLTRHGVQSFEITMRRI